MSLNGSHNDGAGANLNETTAKSLETTAIDYIKDRDRIRIAFCGSAGTGKTTTMEEINKILELPVVGEGVREWMADNKITHLRELSARDTMRLQMEIMRNKGGKEKTLQRFIADRTMLDAAAYCMYWLGRENEMQRGIQQYLTDCMAHTIQNYDYIFLFPYGAIPLEDDGIRSAKPVYQMMIQFLIEYLIQKAMIYSPNTIVHAVRSVSLEDRVNEILTVLYTTKPGSVPSPEE